MGNWLDKFEQMAREEEVEEEKDEKKEEKKEEEQPMSVDEELRYYVLHGDEKKVSELCKAGADVNQPDLGSKSEMKLDDKGKPVKEEPKLYNVAERITGDYPLHLAAERNDCKMVSQLFYLGANMENKNRIGSTALHRSVGMNNIEATTELLKLGADINAKNSIGNTVLHIACYCSHGDMIKLLLEHGGNKHLHTKNKVYLTPIEYTQRKSKERAMLLEQDKELLQYLQEEEEAVADEVNDYKTT